MLGQLAAQRVDQREQRVGRIDETTLIVARRALAEAAVLIRDGQHRDADARVPRRADHARGQLRGPRIARAVRRVMNVMEFAHRRVAAFQHLDIEPARDRGERVGRDLQREAVHQVAPAPERVGRVRAIFGEPRHRALKRVRVQVRHARQQRPVRARDARGRRRIRAHVDERARRVPAQQHVAPPAAGQIRLLGKQHRIDFRHAHRPVSAHRA
nr:hypothetical protein [Burkholderia pseudomallei]